MPRSNKKKKVADIPSAAQSTGEPPPGTLTQTYDHQISLLFSEETAIMISRSIESAKKHGIKLKHGSPNPGIGNCAFEAVIQNVNDRSQFKEKFRMSIDWYRRTWTTDMANRTKNHLHRI